jgi:hypothetical protein
VADKGSAKKENGCNEWGERNCRLKHREVSGHSFLRDSPDYFFHEPETRPGRIFPRFLDHVQIVSDRHVLWVGVKIRRYILVVTKEGTMKYFVLIIVLVAVVLTVGCAADTKKTETTPAPTPALPVSSPVTTIPQVTSESTPSEKYNTADLAMALNTNPVYGFKMDYPSEWTYAREPSKQWKIGYNFSSPDKKSHVYVFVNDASGSGQYWYPIQKWVNNTIKSYTEAYCHDGAGNPMDWDHCNQPNQKLYHPVLSSNDPVDIRGTFEARRLVFTSYDDRYYGQYTLYLMHSGRMQGFNYTVPDHPEVAVQVDGPAWDYGVGGQGYAIEFYSSPNQINTLSKIYRHMIESFEVTTKL